MFNTVDTMHDCTRIATGVVSTLKINPDRMLAGLSADMLATDLAEYLVRKGMLSLIPTLEFIHIAKDAIPRRPEGGSGQALLRGFVLS